MFSNYGLWLTLLIDLPFLAQALPRPRSTNATCRYMPGDAGWPSPSDWSALNNTVGGRLISGVPLGEPCSGNGANSSACVAITKNWTELAPYLASPVNVMSPYWQNDSCSPFFVSEDGCTLGNMAQYAINVSSADDVVAGVNFAREHNIRLTIKNTGHDFLGRSSGKGSLALWTANMLEATVLNYTSSYYNGTAMRLGAGIHNVQAYEAAGANNVRVVGGTCPTVGFSGGFVTTGGHGPLGSSYGMASDNVLEYSVVTAAGIQMVVSPSNNSDLYWALSGGGAGNYAVVISVTIKTHADGQIVGAAFGFSKGTDADQYWQGVSAWVNHMLTLDEIHGFSSLWAVTDQAFTLEFATLPGGNDTDMMAALDPFFQKAGQLNITITDYRTHTTPSFLDHYNYWATQYYDTNNTIGSRLMQRSAVEDNLPALIDTMRGIVNDTTVSGISLNAVGNNYSFATTGVTPNTNSVLPAWRNALFDLTVGMPLTADANVTQITTIQALTNEFQDRLRTLTPGGGTYMNEATFDNVHWKADYYGINYNSLYAVKVKYDPDSLFWAYVAVGSDTYWEPDAEGRLCRVVS